MPQDDSHFDVDAAARNATARANTTNRPEHHMAAARAHVYAAEHYRLAAQRQHAQDGYPSKAYASTREYHRHAALHADMAAQHEAMPARHGAKSVRRSSQERRTAG